MVNEMSVVGDAIILEIDAQELDELYTLAEGRHNPKRLAGIPQNFIPPQGGIDSDFIGLKGEAAVAKYLKVEYSRELMLGGDGGISDLDYLGHTVQVKTTFYPNGNLLFNELHDFEAEFAFLCWTRVDIPYVNILGWIDRVDFLRWHHTRDFGYGLRYYIDQEKLFPVRSFLPYIKSLIKGDQ
jgi:hypothetical protein